MTQSTMNDLNYEEQADGETDTGGEPRERFLGFRVKALRKRRGWSLSELAKATNLSAGYISQLERGVAQPSLATMIELARTFGVSVQWFFAGEPRPNPSDGKYVVRKSDRLRLNYQGGVVDELLPFRGGGAIEMIYCRLPPGSMSGEGLHTQVGDEAGFVMVGEMSLQIEDDLYILKAGDGFSFPGERPHRFFNDGDVETVVIWAITPPEFWSVNLAEGER
ncbi:helix-turn-helix domain-containing protein [Lampropedia aestuarii]|uniref:helix-turn-helix domain-containing protein n=1 Tax=Lampropedia aestuarii TaxID=2562762 RepID=UPI0024690222|nr:XRE family transcriptional regulator [Lampropedia aestuarii]MDH5856592.1 XRE family transcriptional regulator [Lampropedia aestuarii]